MSEPCFWMGGRLARDLVEVSHNPQSLEQPGFWAVLATYEGQWSCARFADVTEADFPESKWQGLNGEWTSSLHSDEYISYVERIREEIALGNVYQANACRVLSTPYEGSLAGLFTQLRIKNPAPYAAYMNIPGWEIASASPELFLDRESGLITCAPIKGTSRNSSFGEKDRAENIMIVDLMRNDFGRICEPGSVTTPHLLEVEEHPGLYHLVSQVKGKLKSSVSWSEIGEALLPAGSISGAPKSSALKIIRENEARRGPYCGALGYVENSRAVLSVGIRIFWKERDSLLRFGTGAGITWGSVARSEWDETELKAKRLISIANEKGRSS